ncbi:MAG: hypothetical protein KDK65_02110 [Chlamydiia bacterium]|nr:hypothetical protein [Chlamydiia bacterium]
MIPDEPVILLGIPCEAEPAECFQVIVKDGEKHIGIFLDKEVTAEELELKAKHFESLLKKHFPSQTLPQPQLIPWKQPSPSQTAKLASV